MILEKLSIAYLETLGFEDNGSVFWVKAFSIEKLIKISFKNIVNLNISRDLLDLDCKDLEIIEVTHEIKKATLGDLKDYQYLLSEKDDLPELNFITLHGTYVITVICQEIQIDR